MTTRPIDCHVIEPLTVGPESLPVRKKRTLIHQTIHPVVTILPPSVPSQDPVLSPTTLPSGVHLLSGPFVTTQRTKGQETSVLSFHVSMSLILSRKDFRYFYSGMSLDTPLSEVGSLLSSTENTRGWFTVRTQR